VEEFYIKNNYMFVEYFGAYWIGARALTFPDFSWVDPVATPLQYASAYKHWGVSEDGQEPQQEVGHPEECVVANNTLEYEEAWGWRSEGCLERFVFICKATGRHCYRCYLRCAAA
jgi:hypothetical protein